MPCLTIWCDLFCIFFVCFVWLVRYFCLFCLASLFCKFLEQGIVMILPRGSLCTKRFFCVFCFLFYSVGLLCFVCLLGLVLLICCKCFSSARTFKTLPRAVCALGALFVWLFVPETNGKTLSQLTSIYKKKSSSGKRC